MRAAVALPPATTVDAFLGGLVEAVQPKHGHHRAGLEAVLLAAAFEPAFAGTATDLGAGVGVAGFGIAARCPDARAVLVERDGEAVACAEAALARPANRAFADRVKIVRADIANRDALRHLAPADAVVMNPPFYRQSGGTRSPKPARAAAHVLGGEGLAPWIDAAASLLKPGGNVTVIFHADSSDALLAALGERFGNVVILPIRPREGQPPHRILVRGVLGGGEPPRELPPLTLHGEAGGAYVPEVDQMLRGRIGLAEAHPPWAEAAGG